MSEYIKTLYLYYKIKNKIIYKTYLDDKPINNSENNDYQLAGILYTINFQKVGYEPMSFTTFSIKNYSENNNKYTESINHVLDPLSLDPNLLYFMTYNAPVEYTTKLYFYHIHKPESNSFKIYPIFNKEDIKYLPDDHHKLIKKIFSPIFFMWKVKNKIVNGKIELINNTEINRFGYYEFFVCDQNICRPTNEDVSIKNFVQCQDQCLKYNIREKGKELRVLKPKINITSEITYRNLIIGFLILLIFIIIVFDFSVILFRKR